MVTNRLSIKSTPLGFRGLMVPVILGALACSRALTPGPGRPLLGTWSSPTASLTAAPMTERLGGEHTDLTAAPLRHDLVVLPPDALAVLADVCEQGGLFLVDH